MHKISSQYNVQKQIKVLLKKERKQIMNNSVKVYVDKFEDEEKYDNLLYYSVIPSIQNAIEASIRQGEWYKSITFEIEELKDYDDETIDQIIDDIDISEDFKYEGFKVDMQFNDDYTVDYYIAVDTDVNDGHLDYELMDKLLTNDYLQDIEVVRRYVKVFNQYNSVISNDDEFIVIDDEFMAIDNEQQLKVTFYITAWGQWGHSIERIEK